MKLTRSLQSFALVTLLFGCASTYNKTVSHVEIKRFMGPWHVQAGRFTSFEKDPYNSVESYTWNEKENRIDVDFHYNQGGFDGPRKEIPQKAFIENKQTNAHWKIQVWWPLRFSYLIVALDPNYEWTAIGVPDEKYLWIMSRTPHLPREKVSEIVKDLDRLGYSTKDLQFVQHK